MRVVEFSVAPASRRLFAVDVEFDVNVAPGPSARQLLPLISVLLSISVSASA